MTELQQRGTSAADMLPKKNFALEWAVTYAKCFLILQLESKFEPDKDNLKVETPKHAKDAHQLLRSN